MSIEHRQRGTRRRLALLVGLAAAGWLVGAAGTAVSGNAYWYCAIPAAVALGWFFVADPTQCEPGPRAPRDGRAPTKGSEP
jgi:CHASE2 domain-containing sensor protein